MNGLLQELKTRVVNIHPLARPLLDDGKIKRDSTWMPTGTKAKTGLLSIIQLPLDIESVYVNYPFNLLRTFE